MRSPRSAIAACRRSTPTPFFGLLQPIWHDKHETASLDCVGNRAAARLRPARKWRTGDNPARWRGNLKPLLVTPKKAVRHYRHSPGERSAASWRPCGPRKASQHGRWNSPSWRPPAPARHSASGGQRLDLENAVWSVPAAAHEAAAGAPVPLSGAALAVLHRMAEVRAEPDGYVFPGIRRASRCPTWR